MNQMNECSLFQKNVYIKKYDDIIVGVRLFVIWLFLKFFFLLHLHEEHDGVARDAAIFAERVHLLVRLRLHVNHILGAPQKLRQVRLDRGLVRADLRSLRDDGAVDVANLVSSLAHQAARFGDEDVGRAPLPLGIVVGEQLTDVRKPERALVVGEPRSFFGWIGFRQERKNNTSIFLFFLILWYPNATLSLSRGPPHRDGVDHAVQQHVSVGVRRRSRSILSPST